MDNEKKIEIPFGAFDSELIRQEIYIPNGFKAVIEGNKIILTRAESEDERIRKTLIRVLNENIGNGIEKYGAKLEDALAWLEKQGEPQDKGEISDGYHTFNELYYYRMLYNAAFFNMLPKEWVHKSKRHNDGEECFGGGWFIVMANLPTGQISNHYELKDWDLFQIPEKEVADKWDGHTPQEAADRLHKYLLEKQGERKVNYTTLVETGNGGINTLVTEELSINSCDEQQPTEKVEPKFQNGQWIVWQNKCYKVNYNGCGYELIDQNGLRTSLEYGTVDKSAHLWTIQDAKDGDIISSPSHHLIWIYKDKEHYHACVNMNCVTDNFFINGLIIVPNDVCPATKNEKNILFASMIEAGYEWNAEKKELKKNNSYCKEHCKGYQETGKCFADGDCKDKREAERKSTWSEDDEYKLNMCITAIETYYKWDSMVDWLKSLKQRIGE